MRISKKDEQAAQLAEILIRLKELEDEVTIFIKTRIDQIEDMIREHKRSHCQ